MAKNNEHQRTEVQPDWRLYKDSEDLKYVEYSPIGKYKSNDMLWVRYVDLLGINFGDYTAIGVDPGRRFGVTIIQNGFARIHYGTMPKIENVAFMYMSTLLIKQITRYCKLPPETPAFIEGAAHGKPYGQVPLAEIRAGFFIGLAENGIQAEMIPPMSARKKAFGNGRVKAYDILLGINPNGADSLGLALYGFEK